MVVDRLGMMIRTGLYLILLTPLLAWSGFLVPHLTAKVLGFQILVEIVAGMALIIYFQAAGSDRPANLERRWLPLLLPFSVSLFVGYSLVTAPFGLDIRTSLWGFIERQDGLVLHLHFYAWYLVLLWFYGVAGRSETRVVSRDSRDRTYDVRDAELNRYMIFFYWTGAAVALLALAEWVVFQIWGITAVIISSAASGGRVAGLFGNPIFLGQYLLFPFFYGFYYLKCAFGGNQEAIDQRQRKKRGRATERRKRSIPLVALILATQSVIFSVILLCKTRGVIFGLFAGIAALAVMFAVSRYVSPALKLAAVSSVLAIALFSAVVWHFRNREWVQSNTLLSRISHFSAAESQTTRMRLMVWQSALQGFPERPVLGVGHDNVYYVLNRYYNPEQVEFDPEFALPETTWYDKSHNAYIDLLVEKGILGALSFLAIAISAFLSLWFMKDRFMAFCLSGGLIAYAVGNIAELDNFGTLFGLFLFLGCISARTLLDRSPESVRRESGGRTAVPGLLQRIRHLNFTPKLVSGTVMILVAFGLYANVQMGRANAGYRDARAMLDQDPLRAITIYQDAFSLFSPYAPREKLKCAYATVNFIIAKKVEAGYLSFALDLARDAVAAHPEDEQTYIGLNEMYNALSLYVDDKFLADAEAAGKKALELSPRRQEAMFKLGRTYVIANRPADAVALNRKMVQEYPNLALAHWFLGLSLISDNHIEEAKLELQNAFSLGYKFQNTKEEETLRTLFGEEELNRLESGK